MGHYHHFYGEVFEALLHKSIHSHCIVDVKPEVRWHKQKHIHTYKQNSLKEEIHTQETLKADYALDRVQWVRAVDKIMATFDITKQFNSTVP